MVFLLLIFQECNTLIRYGHVALTGDNRRLKPILTRSPEERKRIGRLKMKWERDVERVMKQKNLTPVDAVNWQIWRKARTSNWCDTVKLLTVADTGLYLNVLKIL